VATLTTGADRKSRSVNHTAGDFAEPRDIGASVALSDFGTGYSSLSHLQTFPFDKIEIDKSSVSEMSRVDVCAAIVCTIIGEALLRPPELGLGIFFTQENRFAWTKAYNDLAVTMQAGAAAAC
jgi:hypothetical protein